MSNIEYSFRSIEQIDEVRHGRGGCAPNTLCHLFERENPTAIITELQDIQDQLYRRKYLRTYQKKVQDGTTQSASRNFLLRRGYRRVRTNTFTWAVFMRFDALKYIEKAFVCFKQHVAHIKNGELYDTHCSFGDRGQLYVMELWVPEQDLTMIELLLWKRTYEAMGKPVPNNFEREQDAKYLTG